MILLTAASSAAAPPARTDPFDLDPNTVLRPEFERALMRTGQMPVGSRRRRAAVRAPPASLPFEQLPYQAFQEARQILAADRAQKLAEIEEVLSRIAKLQAKPAAQVKGGQKMKDRKLQSMKEWVELLKIRADANDPVIKKRFEDGMGKFKPAPCPLPPLSFPFPFLLRVEGGTKAEMF